MAVAVRWPNSASKSAASTSRRPRRCACDLLDRDVCRGACSGPAPGRRVTCRKPPTPSTTTVTSPSSRPSRRSTVAPDGLPDLRRQRRAVAWPGPGDDPDANRDPAVGDAGPHGRTGEPRKGSAAADLQNARHLERGQAHHLHDDGVADGQRILRVWLRDRAEPACGSLGPASQSPIRRSCGGRRAAWPTELSAIRLAGCWARAAAAPASTANSDHAPLRRPVGDQDHALDAEQRRRAHLLVVEDGPDAADRRAHQQIRDLAADAAAELPAPRGGR